MSSKYPPVKNSAYTFRVYLFAQDDNQIQQTVTLAAGDFQSSGDGGAFGNLATLPSESPAGSGQILVSLSAGEMNYDEVTVRAIDAAGAEWHSAAWVIHTAAQTLDTMDANIDAALADTNELQTDWANGGRLDVILDARASQTTADDILTDTGTDGVVVAPRTIEGGLDEIEALRLILAALVGKATGGGTATVTFRNIGDTKDRIILTVDSSGNRSAVTLDAS